MIEVGDMFLYVDEGDKSAFDIGWVVHTETQCGTNHAGLPANLIYIKWLRHPSSDDNEIDCIWQHHIEQFKEFTLVKGEQHAK